MLESIIVNLPVEVKLAALTVGAMLILGVVVYASIIEGK